MSQAAASERDPSPLLPPSSRSLGGMTRVEAQLAGSAQQRAFPTRAADARFVTNTLGKFVGRLGGCVLAAAQMGIPTSCWHAGSFEVVQEGADRRRGSRSRRCERRLGRRARAIGCRSGASQSRLALARFVRPGQSGFVHLDRHASGRGDRAPDSSAPNPRLRLVASRWIAFFRSRMFVHVAEAHSWLGAIRLSAIEAWAPG